MSTPSPRQGWTFPEHRLGDPERTVPAQAGVGRIRHRRNSRTNAVPGGTGGNSPEPADGKPSPQPRRSDQRQAAPPPKHRVRRERMPQEGMLLQIDGSHHPWLEHRGPGFVLLLAVANALFRPEEDTRGYFLLMDGIVRSYAPRHLRRSPRCLQVQWQTQAHHPARGPNPVHPGHGGIGH